jgi:hypothetical protein
MTVTFLREQIGILSSWLARKLISFRASNSHIKHDAFFPNINITSQSLQQSA